MTRPGPRREIPVRIEVMCGAELRLPGVRRDFRLESDHPRDGDARRRTGPLGDFFRGGRLAKVSARGAAIGFTLDEPSQGSLGAVLTSGQRRYCTLFGGHVKHDGPGTFGAVKAPPPGACPTPGG